MNYGMHSQKAQEDAKAPTLALFALSCGNSERRCLLSCGLSSMHQSFVVADTLDRPKSTVSGGLRPHFAFRCHPYESSQAARVFRWPRSALAAARRCSPVLAATAPEHRDLGWSGGKAAQVFDRHFQVFGPRRNNDHGRCCDRWQFQSLRSRAARLMRVFPLLALQPVMGFQGQAAKDAAIQTITTMGTCRCK